MELVQGCRDRKEQAQVEAVLRRYILYWPDQADCKRAFDDYLSYHLSHGLGILDALIAETAVGQDAIIATFNTKHYGVVEAVRTVQPYKRE